MINILIYLSNYFEIGKMWREDPNPRKINLAVGIYLDAEGKNPVMRAVKEAEKLIFEEEKTKTYLPIDGSPLFLQETKKLLFTEPHTQIAAAQTVGGTGALRILGQYLCKKLLGVIIILWGFL